MQCTSRNNETKHPAKLIALDSVLSVCFRHEGPCNMVDRFYAGYHFEVVHDLFQWAFPCRIYFDTSTVHPDALACSAYSRNSRLTSSIRKGPSASSTFLFST